MPPQGGVVHDEVVAHIIESSNVVEAKYPDCEEEMVTISLGPEVW